MKLFNKGRLRLLITDSCNLSCSYCHNEGQFGKGHFMPVREAGELRDWLIDERIEVKNLIISGGEPTIHPDLIEIVETLRPAAEKLSMVTNGVYLNPPVIDRLAEAGMSYIKFGIDAVDAQTTKGPLDRMPRNVSRERVVENALYAKSIMPGSHLNTVVSRFNLDRVPQLLEWCDANKIGVKFLELIEVRREIALINPRTTTRAHGWFGALYEETRGRLTDFSYNPSVMKFYAKTRSGQDVQFSENFCRFGACSQLWTRIDSSRRLVPCIQKPVTRDLPLTGRGIALVDEVNQEMTRRSMWPCANAEEPPTQDGDEYIVELPDGSTVALPTTERTGCIS